MNVRILVSSLIIVMNQKVPQSKRMSNASLDANSLYIYIRTSVLQEMQ